MFGRHLDFPWGHSWERGNQECTAISQDFTTFRERSYKRTINILRRSSSNAFFLRSAALGKSCILNTEYFIESALSLYLIRRGCWSMKSHDLFFFCSMVIWVWTRAWNVHDYGILYDRIVEVWESSLPALTRVCSLCLYSFHGYI